LWDRGYLAVQIGDPVVTPSGGGVSVVLTVTEGVQYRLGAITIHGQRAFSAEELASLFDIKQGDILGKSRFEEGMQKIYALYDSRGYIDAEPQMIPAPYDPVPGETEAVVDVDIQIDEGDVFVMGEVTIKGGSDLDAKVIRAAISPREGEPFSYRELERSVTRISEDRGLALDLPDDIDVLTDVKTRRVNVIINLSGPAERRQSPKEDSALPELQPKVSRPPLTRRPSPR
jgi:outer membrane protein assembly factor BamA